MDNYYGRVSAIVIGAVFFSISIEVAIGSFLSLSATCWSHWFMLLYFIAHRIKFYLDDVQFYRRVDSEAGLYREMVGRPILEVVQGLETAVGMISWVLWLLPAFSISRGQALYFWLTVVNLGFSSIWILVDWVFLIDKTKDTLAPKITGHVYPVWFAANLLGIVFASVAAAGGNESNSGATVIGAIGLGVILVADIVLNWRFTLGMPATKR